MNLKRNGNLNVNLVVKLVFFLCIINILGMFMLATLNIMFYKANFYNNNYQTNAQIVNIDNKPNTDKININDCSCEALDSLDGIGEFKANKIIENRPYKDIYEIRKFIGETTFNNIKDYIMVKEVQDEQS